MPAILALLLVASAGVALANTRFLLLGVTFRTPIEFTRAVKIDDDACVLYAPENTGNDDCKVKIALRHLTPPHGEKDAEVRKRLEKELLGLDGVAGEATLELLGQKLKGDVAYPVRGSDGLYLETKCFLVTLEDGSRLFVGFQFGGIDSSQRQLIVSTFSKTLRELPHP